MKGDYFRYLAEVATGENRTGKSFSFPFLLFQFIAATRDGKGEELEILISIKKIMI
jgi:hypothetical protein